MQDTNQSAFKPRKRVINQDIDLVQTTTCVTAIDGFFKHPDARAVIFSESYPTSTTVEVRRLSQPELMVEIEVTAIIDDVP